MKADASGGGDWNWKDGRQNQRERRKAKAMRMQRVARVVIRDDMVPNEGEWRGERGGVEGIVI